MMKCSQSKMHLAKSIWKSLYIYIYIKKTILTFCLILRQLRASGHIKVCFYYIDFDMAHLLTMYSRYLSTKIVPALLCQNVNEVCYFFARVPLGVEVFIHEHEITFA